MLSYKRFQVQNSLIVSKISVMELTGACTASSICVRSSSAIGGNANSLLLAVFRHPVLVSYRINNVMGVEFQLASFTSQTLQAGNFP
jgi:hypothetical protein